MRWLAVLILSFTAIQAPVPCPHSHASLDAATLRQHLAACHDGCDEEHDDWHWHLVWIEQVAAPVKLRTPALPPRSDWTYWIGTDAEHADWQFSAEVASQSDSPGPLVPCPLDSPALNQREMYKRLCFLLI